MQWLMVGESETFVTSLSLRSMLVTFIYTTQFHFARKHIKNLMT